MALASPRATAKVFPRAPEDWPDAHEWLRKLSEVANNTVDGKINSTGTVTLTVSSATTVLSDRHIGVNSVILFMPTTANASAEIGNGTIYISSRGKETATVTHANNAQADRTFGYAVLG